jgi:hypothetical protein
VRQLLGRYRAHPRGKAGLLPEVKFAIDEYETKYGGKKPKPLLTFTGEWFNPDGSRVSAPQKRAEFNDDIPY